MTSQTVLRDTAAALDPVLMARRAGINPDPWQAEVLRSPARSILLNCSRQSGKSTATALLTLHTAVYKPGSLSLLLSRTERQTISLLETVTKMYGELGRPVPTDGESASTLRLDNGSKVIALPGTPAGIRGFSNVQLLVVDEAAYVEDALYLAARPMLTVSKGRIVALSTPNGRRGWWADAWHSNEDWQRFEIPATQCPRIDPVELAKFLRSFGHRLYRQEFFCSFEAHEAGAFSQEDIDRAFSEEVTTWEL